MLLDYEVNSKKMVAKYDKYGKKLRIKKQSEGWIKINIFEFEKMFSKEMVDTYIADFDDYVFYIHETDPFFKGEILKVTNAILSALPITTKNSIKVSLMEAKEKFATLNSIVNDNKSSIERKKKALVALRDALKGRDTANYFDVLEEIEREVTLNKEALQNAYSIFIESGRVDITNVFEGVKVEVKETPKMEDLTEGESLDRIVINDAETVVEMEEKALLVFKDFKTPDLKKFLQFKGLSTHIKKVDNIKEIIKNGFGIKDVETFTETL